MKIRFATIDDKNDILGMENLFLSSFNEQQVIYELIENPTSKVLVSEIDGIICGFIDFWITFDSATVCQLAVKKEYQNKGVASRLLEESFKILKDNDVLFYTLEVREHNDKAISLYKKMGFEFVVLKPKYYTNGDNAIYMMRGMK